MADRKFYVYIHIKSTNGTPFYVGKGHGRRMNKKDGRSKYWSNTVNKYGLDIVLLESELTENEAIEKEIYWIKRIGRKDLGTGPLVNLTDGGDGKSNPSKETRYKMSQNSLKYKQEFTERMSKILKGNKFALGNKHTEDWKIKASERHKGNTVGKGRIHITKNGFNRMIFPEELDQYTTTGWSRGRSIKKNKL